MLKKLPELVAQVRENLQVIDAQSAAEKIKELNALVIDVREGAEVEKLPIAGTVHIPRGVLEPQMLTRYGDENHPIFLHCASGVRATFAAEQLQRLGYKNVWVISCKAEDIATAFAN